MVRARSASRPGRSAPETSITTALVPVSASIRTTGRTSKTARRALTRGGPPALRLALCAGAHGGAALLFALMAASVPVPTTHAHNATALVLFALCGLRAGFGALLAGYGLWRHRAGYLSPVRSLDLRIGRIWHDYAAATGIVGIGAAFVFAWLASSGGAAP